MRSDEEVRKNVEDELRWGPDLNADNIAVTVGDGVVALTGFVHSYVDKFIAERVVIQTNSNERYRKRFGAMPNSMPRASRSRRTEASLR
jgi:hypothetical protein